MSSRTPRPAPAPIALPADLDLVDVDEARQIAGGNRKPLSRASFYRGIASGLYPKPIHVSPNIARWLRHELVEAVRRRIAASRAA